MRCAFTRIGASLVYTTPALHHALKVEGFPRSLADSDTNPTALEEHRLHDAPKHQMDYNSPPMGRCNLRLSGGGILAKGFAGSCAGLHFTSGVRGHD